MKKALNISFVYIGLVIGAGFASGREIFEYFSIPSRTDFSGIILAALSFSLLSYIIMSLARSFDTFEFDDFIKHTTPKLAPLVKLFMWAFMFCGYFVMLSASGTLFEETFSLPFGLGVFLLSALCFLVFVFDLSGIVTVNTIMVPIMIVGMSLLCIISSICGLPAFSAFENLKANPLVSSLCYVSYNTVTAGAVLVPLAKIASSKQLKHAAFISGGILGVLIFSVWFALNLCYDNFFSAEMPLLELAAFYGYIPRTLYSIVLFMALSTTAISHGFGILSKFHFKNRTDRLIAAAVFCLAAMPFAKFGFSVLVSNLYAAFGFLGMFWTALVIFRYLKPRGIKSKEL